MPIPDPDQEKSRQAKELRLDRQIAFASGLFQGDVTVRTLLESLAEGVVIMDNSGAILLVNTAAEQMFGYQREDLIGKPQAVLIPERFRKVHEEHLARFFAEPRMRPTDQLLDLTGLRRDGDEFPVEISLSYVDTINGVLVMALVSDVSLRKEYETRLRESEEMFHMQVAWVKDYAIFMLDTQGNVLTWNEGAERLKGYRAQEIIGKHFSCFYPEEDRNAGRPEEELKKAADQGQFAEDTWRTRKDGSRFWANVTIAALHDESGKLRGFTKVIHDISVSKKAEDALRKSEDKFSKIFQSAPAIIGITSLAEGRCLDINDRGLQALGYQREEVVGKTMLELGVWESKSVRDRVIRVLEEDGMVKNLEINFRGKNGKTFIGIYSAETIDLGGERYILDIVQDITERKRMEEEIVRLNTHLEVANKEQVAFNHTVAHDLRQPLNLLSSYCQLIDKMCGDQLTEECKGYVRGAYNVTLQMNSLIAALLNFSNMGIVEPRREMVDLSLLAQEVSLSLKMTEPERQVDFRNAKGIVANGDANLLRAVLDNLLGNAWKYTGMREKAVIEFGVMNIDGVPTYFVRDNGTGFDMAYADKLFVPFQRLPGAEKQTGFGVGLATAERIIRRHGGTMWAEGEPDKGACFYFTLSAD